jgi:hypothetical protein
VQRRIHNRIDLFGGQPSSSEGLRLITRVMLMPIIGIAYLMLHLGMFMTLLLSTIAIFTIVMLRRKIRYRLKVM